MPLRMRSQSSLRVSESCNRHRRGEPYSLLKLAKRVLHRSKLGVGGDSGVESSRNIFRVR